MSYVVSARGLQGLDRGRDCPPVALFAAWVSPCDSGEEDFRHSWIKRSGQVWLDNQCEIESGQFCKNTPDIEICMGITQISCYKLEISGLYAGRKRFGRGTSE